MPILKRIGRNSRNALLIDCCRFVKRLIGGLIILAVFIAALYVPLDIPYGAESIGRVFPVREWRLVMDQTGRISSIIRDHRLGSTRQIDAYQFDQGDFSGLQFDLPADRFIAAGDTVVRMYSIQQNEDIQSLEAQIALYEAQLQSDVTGEKPPIVQEAENRLHFAEQDLNLREQQYQLKKPLWEQGLIALTEFQEVENAYELARIQVEIARKYLENVGTGVKNEQVGVTRAQLLGLKKRLAILRQKGLAFVIRAPFSGRIAPATLPEEQLILQQCDAYIVHIPVKIEYLPYLDSLKQITVTDVQTLHSYRAQLLETGTKVEVMGSQQVSTLTALLQADSMSAQVSTGISAMCRLDFGHINQREYLRRILKFNW